MALRIRLRWTLPAPGLAIGVVPSIKPGHPPARCVGGIVAAHPATVASSSLVCCVSAGRGVAYLIDGLRRPAVDQMAARRCAQRSLPQNPGDAMRFQAKKKHQALRLFCTELYSHNWRFTINAVRHASTFLG